MFINILYRHQYKQKSKLFCVPKTTSNTRQIKWEYIKAYLEKTHQTSKFKNEIIGYINDVCIENDYMIIDNTTITISVLPRCYKNYAKLIHCLSEDERNSYFTNR